MKHRAFYAFLALSTMVLLASSTMGDGPEREVPLGSIGVDPVPPMISNFTMETPDKNPLREIRVLLVMSDYNGFEDISTVNISLYYYDELQASAYARQDSDVPYSVWFEDIFGGFLDKDNSDASYIKSSNWIEENTSRKFEFYFKPVPVTDVKIESKDRSGLGIVISTAISPSARPSKIKEAYIPWMIALVIASIVAIALLWIRNSSNRLAKIAEQSRKKVGKLPLPVGAGDAKR